MSSSGYGVLLFDLDHTLLDTDAAERAAYVHACAEVGFGDADAEFERYRSINRAMWAAVERGELQPLDVRTERFARFAAELDERYGDRPGGGFDPAAMADAFVWGFSHLAELFEGARELLEALRDERTMALVTNGLSDVQRIRLARLGLDRYFEAVVVSGEVGIAKPDPAIFDVAFEALGVGTRSDAVMIGDSISSDMRGGIAAGIATCWFNPAGTPAPNDVAIDHVANSYDAVHRIAIGRPAGESPDESISTGGDR